MAASAGSDPTDSALNAILIHFPDLFNFVDRTRLCLNDSSEFLFGGRRVLSRIIDGSRFTLNRLLGADYSSRRLMDLVTECIDKTGLAYTARPPSAFWHHFVATSIICSEYILPGNVSPSWSLERRQSSVVRLIAAETLRVAKGLSLLPLPGPLRAASHVLLGMGLRRTLKSCCEATMRDRSSCSSAARSRPHAPPDVAEIPLPPQVRRLETVESLEELTRSGPVD